MAAGAIHHLQLLLAQRMREHPRAATPTSAAVPAITPMATRWSTLGLNPPYKNNHKNSYFFYLWVREGCVLQ